jgi:hypothetical protein
MFSSKKPLLFYHYSAILSMRNCNILALYYNKNIAKSLGFQAFYTGTDLICQKHLSALLKLCKSKKQNRTDLDVLCVKGSASKKVGHEAERLDAIFF